ncbi:MAG: hypothetical protein KJ955_01820 [Nanoarchaeota archaeon]|nr:hypothetical protein [Nanoarchaeota archaeon]
MDLTFRVRKARRKAAGKNPIEFEVEYDPPISRRCRRLGNKDFSDLLIEAIMALKEKNPSNGIIITLDPKLPSKYVTEVQDAFERYAKAEGVRVTYQ